jgi:hypothetical protein
MVQKEKNKSKRLKPLSLYPLKAEKVLSAFMEIRPKSKKKRNALSSA